MIEIIISMIVYWAIFAIGVQVGNKKGKMDERKACMRWAMGLNSKTLEDWQKENEREIN